MLTALYKNTIPQLSMGKNVQWNSRRKQNLNTHKVYVDTHTDSQICHLYRFLNIVCHVHSHSYALWKKDKGHDDAFLFHLFQTQ